MSKKDHRYTISIVGNGAGDLFTVTVPATFTLDQIRKAIREGVRDEVFTVGEAATRARGEAARKKAAAADRKKLLDAQEAAKAEKQAARDAVKREKDRKRAAVESKKRARQAEKDARAEKRRLKEWVKLPPAVGDAVEYQEVARGRRRFGVVMAVLDSGGYKVRGDRGVRAMPAAQVRRTLKELR